MVAFSCLRLRATFEGCCRLRLFLKAGDSCKSTLNRETKRLLPVRGMAGAAKVPLKPSIFQYFRFKDSLHFFICIGIIPLGLVAVGSYVFIGPAELVDTPKGYEPKHWEYYSNPIKRFMGRYVFENPAVVYEKQLDVLHRQTQISLDHQFREKIQKAMAERQDFRGFYFYTYDKYKTDRARKIQEEHEKEIVPVP